MRRRRQTVSRKHQSLFHKFHGRCFYCEHPMVLPVNGKERKWPSAITRDHLMPRSLGGRGLPNNIVAAIRSRCPILRFLSQSKPHRVPRCQLKICARVARGSRCEDGRRDDMRPAAPIAYWAPQFGTSGEDRSARPVCPQ